MNATIGKPVMFVNDSCQGLFVDIFGSIYCSIYTSHGVMKRWSADDINSSRMVAGNGTAGSALHTLNNPRGIFVDATLNLYVADCGNSRVQFFLFGKRNGTTLVGAGVPGTTTLSYPIAIVLDADGYIFITDTSNDRIVGSGPNGFRCIVGCTGVRGSNSDQFNSSRGLSFDSDGNLFVSDGFNDRIQKFSLAKNSCGR